MGWTILAPVAAVCQNVCPKTMGVLLMTSKHVADFGDDAGFRPPLARFRRVSATRGAWAATTIHRHYRTKVIAPVLVAVFVVPLSGNLSSHNTDGCLPMSLSTRNQ